MKNNILKIFILCAAVLFISSAFTNGADAAEIQSETVLQDGGVYSVTAKSGLKMRSGPSTSDSVLTLLPYGVTVTVTEQPAQGWCQIEYDGMVGYVSADYLVKSDADVDTDSAAQTEAETEDELISTEQSSLLSNYQETTSSLGTEPIIYALIAAIIIMLLLAAFTAFSFFKRNDDRYGGDDYDIEYYDDEDEENAYIPNNYSRGSKENENEDDYDIEYYDDEDDE